MDIHSLHECEDDLTLEPLSEDADNAKTTPINEDASADAADSSDSADASADAPDADARATPQAPNNAPARSSHTLSHPILPTPININEDAASDDVDESDAHKILSETCNPDKSPEVDTAKTAPQPKRRKTAKFMEPSINGLGRECHKALKFGWEVVVGNFVAKPYDDRLASLSELMDTNSKFIALHEAVDKVVVVHEW